MAPRRSARTARLAASVLGAVVLTVTSLTGCALISDAPAAPTLPPRPADETWTPPQIPGATPVPTEDVTFTSCPREAPAPGRSDLVALPTLPEVSRPGDPLYGGIPFDGPLLVEDAGDLHLPDGRIGVGNGGDALWGGGPTVVAVADGPVTAAVSVAVLDSAYSGRRVAFLAARLPGGPAVRWEEPGAMGTDGGDAALTAPGAMLAPTDEGAALTQMVEATFDDDGVCALRHGGDAVDAVVTTIGGGDGGYPVLVGRDADGAVVGVVVWGLITPWEWSGLPGEPPPDL